METKNLQNKDFSKLVKISEGNTKLGKVFNVSLPPGLSCQPDVPCAEKCYAKKAWRLYPEVRNAWMQNWNIWKADNLDYMGQIATFIAERSVERFRWHVSGDIPDRAYYKGMCMIASCNPDTKFLAFTKNFNIISAGRPDNLQIIASMWPGLESTINLRKVEGSAPICWVLPKEEPESYKKARQLYGSNALSCNGKCDECFLCWYLEPFTSVAIKEH